MSNSLSAETTLKGSSIIGALKKAQVRTVVALPDIVTCEHVLWPISKDKSFRLVQVCKEDEGIGICAGLSYCDHRAVLLIQHTGFLDSINAIRAVAVEYHLPIVMLVWLARHGIGSFTCSIRQHWNQFTGTDLRCTAVKA